MATVTIGGEERQIADFSAFKAIYAIGVISSAQETFREVLEAGATFKREWEQTHYSEMDRAEARRQFRPRPLYRDVPIERDGAMVMDDGVPLLAQAPVLNDAGDAVLGPDPLGHLTEEDWAASGQRLRMPESPSPGLERAAMVEAGFRLARPQVMRLLALAIATNDDLERWDGEDPDGIDAKLDTEGRRLMHSASAAELVRLALALSEISREQLAGPLGDLQAGIKSMRRATEPTTAGPPPAPMRIETEPEPDGDSTGAPTSPTESPAATDGPPTSSSTGSHSGSSPVSAIA